MKSIKRLFFVVGCVALCNAAFADQLELADDIIYGTANGVKGAEQSQPSFKQVQVQINNGAWHDVPMTYRRGTISLNNNEQYAIRVQTADGKWYHTHPLKYSAARDGSSKNLSIHGWVGPVEVVQDGIRAGRFYGDAIRVGNSHGDGIRAGNLHDDPPEMASVYVKCSYDGRKRIGQCDFTDRDQFSLPPKVTTFEGKGSSTVFQQWSARTVYGFALIDTAVEPGRKAIASVLPYNDGTGIIMIDPAAPKNALAWANLAEPPAQTDDWEGSFVK